jgi:adenine-specific DNA-methyltransferase
MKIAPTYQKLRGGYYTPKPIAYFLARWAIQSSEAEILEPSCGDGILLEAVVEALIDRGADKTTIAKLVQGIEIDPLEATKALDKITSLGIPFPSAQIHVGDFFTYCASHLVGQNLLNLFTFTQMPEEQRFDAVIGNPPFIRYQNFPEEYRSIALSFMRQAGLHPNRLTNTWLPFLVTSALLLKEQGRVAMVIPAELFQVNYAAETRQFLSDFFDKITIVTFKKLVFDDIQQEIVLFLGERDRSQSKGIRTIEFENAQELSTYSHPEFSMDDLKPIDHSTEKWTQYFLDKEEILLLRSLRANPKLTTLGKVASVDVGVVTGENRFFILNEQQVKDWSLEPFAQRIVSRSSHLQGMIFHDSDWVDNVKKQHAAFLLCPPKLPLDQLPEPLKAYIVWGEQANFNKGYKCQIRTSWYIVPSIWTPEAFMLRQVHGYPKIILNAANATCTDTIHRVRFLNETEGKTIATAFINSLTLAFSEVTGRSYGGGVLTFEPTEAESLPIPLIGSDALDICKLDQVLRANDIETALDATDAVLLKEGLGLSSDNILMLRGIWKKLRDRRINRKHRTKNSISDLNDREYIG